MATKYKSPWRPRSKRKPYEEVPDYLLISGGALDGEPILLSGGANEGLPLNLSIQ